MGSPEQHLTQLLQAWSKGRQDALEEIIPIVYEDLRRLASRYMSGERPSHTLQPTALVNEAYVRLVDATNLTWRDRSHFFSVCGRLMRRILVDWARSRRTLKRGSDVPRMELEEEFVLATDAGADFVDIDDALKALALIDDRKCQVVELRFFAGLNARETGEVLGVSEETVLRDWKLAKSWLKRELSREVCRGN
jgi:RNA polymerase sigma-70 factor (ECF subfamily)